MKNPLFSLTPSFSSSHSTNTHTHTHLGLTTPKQMHFLRRSSAVHREIRDKEKCILVSLFAVARRAWKENGCKEGGVREPCPDHSLLDPHTCLKKCPVVEKSPTCVLTLSVCSEFSISVESRKQRAKYNVWRFESMSGCTKVQTQDLWIGWMQTFLPEPSSR